MGLIGDVVGGIEGLVGFNQARQKAKGDRGAINRAYKMATMQQGLDQANIRQNTNEGLNARGVLAAGAAPAPGTSMSPIAQSVAKTGAYRGFYNNAQQGAVGPANTLGGQVNSNLGDQFYKEQKALYDTQQAGLHGVSANETNSILGSAIGGVQTAMNVNAGQAANGMAGAITGAFGMPVNLGPSSGAGLPAAVGTMSGGGDMVPPPSVPDSGPTGSSGAISRAAGGTMVGDSNTSNANFNVG